MAEQWDFLVDQTGFGISVGRYNVNQEQKFVAVSGTHPQLYVGYKKMPLANI